MRVTVVLVLALTVAMLGRPALSQTPPVAPPAPAATQELDAPAPLFCTLTSAHTCTGQTCTKAESYGDLKLPAKLLVHFEGRVVASTSPEGFPHISHIASFAKTANDYIVQGVDHATGWMIHLDEGGQRMSFTSTSNAIALIGTGSCKKAG